jgi:hypothetical protein
MIGKARANPDRTSGDAARQASSGGLIGMSGIGRTAAGARAGLRAARRPADPAITTVRSAAADAQKSRLPQMAAALAYRTIFGLLPVLVVALAAVTYFASKEDVRMVVEKSLEYSGLSAIAVEPETVGPPAPAGEGTDPEGAAGEEEVGAAPANATPSTVDIGREDLLDGYLEAEKQARLIAELNRVFAEKSANEWQAILGDVDCCFTVVKHPAEIADDPHYQARGLLGQFEDGTPWMRSPARISGSEPTIENVIPGYGEHTREVLLEADYDDDAIDALIAAGAVK